MNRSGSQGRHLPYMPGLDGLRAFAVVGVVLYHADVSWMPAGFIGVDIFFVISGFLITSLLLSEHESRGGIWLGRFWLRRALRLLPALFLLLTVTMGIAVLFLPDEVDRLRGDVVAGFFYFTNWDLIARDTSYFEAFGRPPILRHLWSLAIEEQFYIVWPVLLGLALRFLPRRLTLGLIVAGIAGSTALMWSLFDPFEDPSRLYFGTDTRVAGLLVGAAVAFLWRAGTELPARAKLPLDLVGVAALAALAFLMVDSNEFAPFLYKGGFLLVAILTAVVLVAAVHPLGLLGRGLGWFPIRWIGLRSYAIYLWHWPIFMFARSQDVGLDGAELLALRVAITLVAAELSFRLVERPVRQGALVRWWRMLRSPSPTQVSRAAVGVGALAAALILIVVAFSVVSVPTRFEQALANQLVPLEAAAPEVATPRSLTAPFAASVASGSTDRPAAEPGPDEVVTVSDPAFDAPEQSPGPQAPTSDPDVSAIDPAPLLADRTVSAAVQPDIILAPVLAIGDSVMLGARNILFQTFDSEIAIDTAISRSFADAIPLVQTLLEIGLVPDTLVLHLGTNNPVYDEQFEAMMDVLRDVPQVIFVNVRVPQRWEGISNKTLRDGVGRWPNASLVDWHGVASDADHLFAEDGVHLQIPGAQLYSRLIREGVEQVVKHRQKRRLRTGSEPR